MPNVLGGLRRAHILADGLAARTAMVLVLASSFTALPALARAQGCVPPFLAPPVEIPLTSPDVASQIAVGDFNGDKVMDLAVTTVSSSFTLSVLLGTGSGSFASPARYSVPSSPSALAVGDFNGDGHPDLAVTHFFADQVSVLLGTGGGAFGAATPYPAGTNSNPYDIATADFNGDGKLDVVVASNGISGASILLGDGTGALGTPTHFTAGSSPIFVAVADLNKDGKKDVVVANYDPFNSSLSILLGNGAGGLTAAAPVAITPGPRTVAIADFNGDGSPDLAVTSLGVAPYALSILLGDGAGGFGTPSIIAGVNTPHTVEAADFNGDGKQDLAVGQDGDVSVLIGNGLGGFAPPVTVPTADAVTSSAVADLNGGGRPDFAFPLGGVWLLFNTCPAFGAFHTVTPCRILDSREATGPFGGLPLYAGAERRLTVGGSCAILGTARAISVNVTIAQPTADGNVRLYPGGTATPLVSTLNLRVGQTRANNAIATLGASSDLALLYSASYGSTTHVVIDVNGYFE